MEEVEADLTENSSDVNLNRNVGFTEFETTAESVEASVENGTMHLPAKDLIAEATTSNKEKSNGVLEETALPQAESMEVDQTPRSEGTLNPTEEILQTPEETYEDEFFQGALIELGRVLWSSTVEEQHYTKGCLWSPDGTCLLVPVHLDGMHIYEMPTDLYTATSIDFQRPLTQLTPAVHVSEGGTVYDCAWYPYMNSQDPNTCCWLATRQHEPIHLWDAFDGSLRCTYRGYDAVDEVEAAISVIFSLDAQKVIGGYKKSIKVFDTNIPGRDYFEFPVKQAVSCFAINDDHSATTGSWKGFINHYDLRAPQLGALFTLGGHLGGITWLRFGLESNDGENNWMLFSGARKDDRILQWDMRNYTKPVHEFHRRVTSNQRIYFDFSPQERWLVSGSSDGNLRIWDLQDKSVDITLPLHNDCCNGVSMHPTRPILATSSGQYRLVDMALNEEGEATADTTQEKVIDYENSLLLLWCGKTSMAETL